MVAFTIYPPSAKMKTSFGEEFRKVSTDFCIAYAVFGLSLMVGISGIRYLYRIRQRLRAVSFQYEQSVAQMERGTFGDDCIGVDDLNGS
jgi:hypothetical protein